MSNKEFELFLTLIIKLLEKGDTEEVLSVLKKAVGEIGAESSMESK